MSVRRGDVVLVDWPFSSGARAKLRPGLIVQNDRDNARLSNTILAMITSTTRRAAEPTQVLIEVSTSEGALSGLHRDSVVNCINLFTIEQVKVVPTIGKLPASLLQRINDCLKAALELL